MICMSGCSSRPHVIDNADKNYVGGANQIYVVSHGWHTGFIIPAADVQSRLPEIKERFSKAQYIEFGWGDKGFYQAKEITTSLALRAILWPTKSVLHVVGIPNSDVKELFLSSEEMTRLIQFISESFARDKTESLLPTKLGIYGNSQFYKGVGNYYLMNTCNKWTAKGLKSVGLNIYPTFKLTSGSVMDFVHGVESMTRLPESD
jgi:uncharacterized protein (TIGR02117 family)